MTAPPGQRVSLGARARGLLADTTPLRESPAFRRLWIGNGVAGIGSQMTITAIGIHLYDLTGSTQAVALLAAFTLLPMIVAGLYGGMLADALDRRRVALITAIVAWGSTAVLAGISWLGNDAAWPLYALATLNAVAATVLSTARSSIIPRLVPASQLPAALALGGIETGLMVTIGPALAGVLIAAVGFAPTYTVDVILFTAAFTGIFSLPPVPPEGVVDRPGLASIRSGIAFLKTAPNVRMSFLIDIVAMTFGQPRVLFPAVGALVLGGGSVTVGVLTAAGAVGAIASGLLSGPLGAVRMQGRAIALAVAAFGACTLAFGLVLGATGLGMFGPAGLHHVAFTGLVLASIALAASGAADNVSSVFRNTVLQAAVPDRMRGRLQGIFIVVVTGGPRLGDLFVGALVGVAGLWLPPLLGGAVVIVFALGVWRFHRGFRTYDGLHPVA